MLSVAHQDGEGATSDDARPQDGGTRAVLDWKRRRRTVAHHLAEGAFDSVAKSGHWATIAARLSPFSLLRGVLRTSSAALRKTFRAGL